MSSWGFGNFGNDTAADYLSLLVDTIVGEIQDITEDSDEMEPDQFGGAVLPCKLEILYLLKQQNWGACGLPSKDIVNCWKEKYLMIWDKYMEENESKADYVIQRREIIVDTFNKLID